MFRSSWRIINSLAALQLLNSAVAADRIGRASVQYVRNIYKHSVACKLLGEQLELRKVSTQQ